MGVFDDGTEVPKSCLMDQTYLLKACPYLSWMEDEIFCASANQPKVYMSKHLPHLRNAVYSPQD